VSEQLYSRHLPEQAARILAAGMTVVVDATFLLRDQRNRMEALAHRCGVPFLILACLASQGQARRQIEERRRLGADPSDADLAVLEGQLRLMEPLEAEERPQCLEIGPELPA
jgi:predicted kinase